MNKVSFPLLLLVVILLAGCSTPEMRQSPQLPSSASLTPRGSTVMGDVRSRPGSSDPLPFPGLYLNSDMRYSGGGDSVTVQSFTSCSNLMEALAAGEWALIEPPHAYGMPGSPITQALFKRNDALLFVQATSSLLKPLPGVTPSPGTPPGETCAAKLDILTRQPVRAQGLEAAEGVSLVYPLTCARTDGIVTANLAYEGPGDFRGWLAFRAPDSLGVHTLYLDDGESFKLVVGHSSSSYFASLRAQDVPSGDKLPFLPWVSEQTTSLSLGTQFSGTVQIRSNDPLEGEINLTGLEDEAGQTQTLRAGFRCANGPRVLAPRSEPPRFTVSVELLDETNYAPKEGGFKDVHQTRATLRGDLLRVDTNRYEGIFSAEGAGSFAGYNYDGGLVECSTPWTGSQSIKVIGKADSGGLTLLFKPQGPPQLKFGVKCGLQEEYSNFPNAEGLRAGKSPFLKWPSGAPDTATQRLEKVRAFPDSGPVGKEVWVFQFEAKQN